MLLRIITIIASASLLSVAGAEQHASVELLGGGRPRHPIAATLKLCPDGHATLKDVPILYGLPPFARLAAKRFEERIKRYEIWPGGCQQMPDSPAVRPTCITCGFGFDSRFLHWSRESPDITTFKRPFSPLIVSFPKPRPEHQKGAFGYNQSVSTNQVVSQNVSYSSSEPWDSLIGSINAWFKTNRSTPKYTEQTLTSDLDGSEKLISDWQAGGVSVMLHYSKKSGDSWVMVHVSN